MIHTYKPSVCNSVSPYLVVSNARWIATKVE